MYRWRRASRFGTRALLRLPRIDRGLGHYGFMSVGPIHWAARGAEGVVIALDFSSTRWATFFALSLFYFLLQVRLRRFRPFFTGAFLACALGTSVVPSPTPFNQFHAVHPFQARESVGTSSIFTWPVASACLGNAAFPGRDRRGSALRLRSSERFDFCAGHGNLLFSSHPPYDAGDLRRGYRRLSSLPPLLALDCPSCWPFGQALVRPFVCARVVVFYNYFGHFWFCQAAPMPLHFRDTDQRHRDRAKFSCRVSFVQGVTRGPHGGVAPHIFSGARPHTKKTQERTKNPRKN